MDEMKQSLSKAFSSISRSYFRGLSIRIGPIWLFLLVVLSLSENASAFRVTQRSVEKRDRMQEVDRIIKRATVVRSCYEHCQSCRNIYGYSNYNYRECVGACDRSEGRNFDTRCMGFRTENKRTEAQRQQIGTCKRACKRFERTSQNCGALEMAMGALLCKDFCNKMQIREANGLTCAAIKQADREVFQVTD